MGPLGPVVSKLCLVVLTRSDTGALGPVASICTTPANRQTDGQMDGRVDGHQMLGYVMSFAD